MHDDSKIISTAIKIKVRFIARAPCINELVNQMTWRLIDEAMKRKAHVLPHAL